MNAIAYIRCSTEEQASSGLGLDAQTAAIQAECSRRGWHVAHTAIDHCSTRRLDRREALLSALQALEHGTYQALVVSRLDRLSRSVGEFAGFVDLADKQHWAIVVLDPPVDLTTPFGKAMAGVASVFAQLERDLISQRTKEALAIKKAQGVILGPPKRVSEATYQQIKILHRLGLSSAEILARVAEPISQRHVRRIAATA
jgi:DNA invertase Pin-like site-specific DNA recombinase